MCRNGKYPCVLKYYLLSCQRFDKPLPMCMCREQPREQDPAVLQETRESDPHYKEFEEASKNLGGNGQAGLATPTPGAASGSRAQRAMQRAARRVNLEQQVEALTETLTELVKQGKAPAIRKVKSPKTQASSSSESGSDSESEALSSDESVDPHKARPLPRTSVAGSSPSRKFSSSSKASSHGKKKGSQRIMCFPAKKEVQSAYQERHERKLRTIPEDFALALEDLAERPDLMYDFHAFEQADWNRRSWGLHLEHETEALGKLEQRKREKQHSLFSEGTKRRGMRWISNAHDSPNWPLDEVYDEDGVSKHGMYEQWTPLLDGHVDYGAIQYLYERYPELFEQLVSADSPVELFMEDHLVPNTSQ